jgi:hypothetical protein
MTKTYKNENILKNRIQDMGNSKNIINYDNPKDILDELKEHITCK